MTEEANVGEYGQLLRLNVSEDISAAVITLEIAPPNSISILKLAADGVTVPVTPASIDESTEFQPNEYAEYLVEAGVLDGTAGTWRVRLIAQWTSPNKLLKTDWEKFTVSP